MTTNFKGNKKLYSKEQKEEISNRLLPPFNVPIAEMSKETGIPVSTLSTWKQKHRKRIKKAEADIKPGKELSSREKFLVVMETFSFSEIQLAEYCRTKGLYVEQVKKWLGVCLDANSKEKVIPENLKNELQQEKKKARMLEKELNRKEKALAETAALLVLRKKLGAILGDQEGE